MIPKTFFNPDNTGTLRLLEEHEWRGIGITQSLGWEHYEVHGESCKIVVFLLRFDEGTSQLAAPEPHVLLFRRPKNFDDQLRRQELQRQQQVATKGKAGTARRK